MSGKIAGISNKQIRANQRNNAAIGNGMYSRVREFTRKKKFFVTTHVAKHFSIEYDHANAILGDFVASGELRVVGHLTTSGKPARVFTRAIK